MGKLKIIEIHGAGFKNKGAELMLDAICQAVYEQEGFKLALHWGEGRYEDRASRCLFNKVSVRRLNRVQNYLNKWVPQRAKEALGIVFENEIDVVFDAAGFAYSDQWGPEAAKHMAEWANSKEGKKKKFILLPQAFGPFENVELKRYAKAYFSKASLIYARDETSLKYLKDLLGVNDKVKMAPDFTCLLKADDVERPTSGDYACIVPNCRMLDMLDGGNDDDYYKLLLSVGGALQKRGVKVVLVNHEGDEDLAIVRRLEIDLGESVVVVSGKNGKYLKGVFKNAKLVVGSRFHALISTLIQGVPAIGMGWSHKYERLFSDFGCSDYLVEVSIDTEDLLKKLDSLLVLSSREKVIEAALKGGGHYKIESEQLWKTVFEEIR